MNSGSEKSEDGRSSRSPPSRNLQENQGSGCPSCRQLLCSCVKSPADLLNYQRLASVPSLVYHGGPNPSNPSSIPNTPYSPDQISYIQAAAAAANAAFFSMNGGGLPDAKEGGLGPSAWGYPAMYHPGVYDPGFMASAAAYPFNGYGSMDGSRRKNATRETTSTLKAWLAEHKKNPYPTKGEKIMLAIITKMTLTQVSTWFANARRRLKKENKMTWSPRTTQHDDDVSDVDISDSEPESSTKKNSDQDNSERLESTNSHVHGKSSPTGSSDSTSSAPNTKPPNTKIWSVADLAAAGNGTGGSHHQNHHRLNNHHHPSLQSSAFSPIVNNRHSESLYRGLYPMSHPPYHSSDNP